MFLYCDACAGIGTVGNKGRDFISSYITGDIPGGLGSHNRNGVTSQVIAFFLGFFHGLAIEALRIEAILFRYSTCFHSKNVFLQRKTTFRCSTALVYSALNIF